MSAPSGAVGVAVGRPDARSAVLAALHAMYQAFLDDDRTGFDRYLDPQTTSWEDHFPHLYSRAELDGYRDRRPAEQRPALRDLRVLPHRVEVWGRTALAAYDLHAVPVAGGLERTRVTDVLRHDGHGWRIVHHHAQAGALAGRTEAGA